jgi:hypothetical protein
MTVAVCYPDKYPVEETFQLLKIPWVWYEKGRHYDVVIARKADVAGYDGPLIDLTDNDLFERIRGLLNDGQQHLHEPVCDILIDQLRQDLRHHTLLVEIPPVPWDHPYLVALTHDVDVTSVRECRFLTVGNAAYQCIRGGNLRAGLRLVCARCGIGPDPWVLFEQWKTLEGQLGVSSTFFFVPKRDDPGIHGHSYRAVGYSVCTEILNDLAAHGWEAGVHGIDNWASAEEGIREMAALGRKHAGNRTHWLLFTRAGWALLDKAGYSYDTTFGYNDDAGFRAGTLQVYQPENAKTLLELPLHIQDLGLFMKSCWAPSEKGWEKTPCLHLTEPAAREHAHRIFAYARKFGGAVTMLWHYENITPPRDWSGLYRDLVSRATTEGAWVTTAGHVVEWFRSRRQVSISCTRENDTITIRTGGDLPEGSLPSLMLRIHIPDTRQITVNTEYRRLSEYMDIRLDKKIITVSLS